MYIEIKSIGGRKYKYLRKSVRDGDKMRHVTLKYLGPVNPIYRVSRKRKTNASIYVRELSDIESTTLEKATKSTNSFTKDRANILLLSAKKHSPTEIAEKIKCEARKVRKAIAEFNKQGLSALERKKAKGAKPKFTKEQKAKILEAASTDPIKLGMHFSTWSLPKLKRYLIGNKIVNNISIETIRSLLKDEKIKLRKSKRHQYSNDPEFFKKN